MDQRSPQRLPQMQRARNPGSYTTILSSRRNIRSQSMISCYHHVAHICCCIRLASFTSFMAQMRWSHLGYWDLALPQKRSRHILGETCFNGIHHHNDSLLDSPKAVAKPQMIVGAASRLYQYSTLPEFP